MSHGGLGTREYYEECVAKTVRTVKRALRKRSNHAVSPKLKSGENSKWDSAKKTPTMTTPAPESVKIKQEKVESARKASKMMAPPAKSVKIRITKTVEPFSWAKTKRYQPVVALKRLPPPKKAAPAKKRPNAESASSIAKRIRLMSVLAESETREVCSLDGFLYNIKYRVVHGVLYYLLLAFN